ncbi:T9SS type A sorting domain-containing protein [bacterium]|nr:T9SS type A sorting domain-containing protein [bacterium]
MRYMILEAIVISPNRWQALAVCVLLCFPVLLAAQLNQSWVQTYGQPSQPYRNLYSIEHIQPAPDGGWYLGVSAVHSWRQSFEATLESRFIRIQSNGETIWATVRSGDLIACMTVLFDSSIAYGLNSGFDARSGYETSIVLARHRATGVQAWTTNGNVPYDINPWLGAMCAFPDETHPGPGLNLFVSFAIDNAPFYDDPSDIDLYFRIYNERGQYRESTLHLGNCGSTHAPRVVQDALRLPDGDILVYARGRNFPGEPTPDYVSDDFLLRLNDDLQVTRATKIREFNPDHHVSGYDIHMLLTRDGCLMVQSGLGIGKYDFHGRLVWFREYADFSPRRVARETASWPALHYVVGTLDDGEDTQCVGAIGTEGDLYFFQPVPEAIELNSLRVAGIGDLVVGGAVEANDPYGRTFEQAILIKYGNSYRERMASDQQPAGMTLLPVSPNPFNSSTTISFDLNRPTPVNLSFFDLLGREVRVLSDGQPYAPGTHRVVWDASGLPGGTYFLRASTEDEQQVRRMLFLK